MEIKKIADSGKFDLVLIEGTGIAEPLQVAETFTFQDEAGKSLNDFARLDTMITMVDAVQFFNYIHSRKKLLSCCEWRLFCDLSFFVVVCKRMEVLSGLAILEIFLTF